MIAVPSLLLSLVSVIFILEALVFWGSRHEQSAGWPMLRMIGGSCAVMAGLLCAVYPNLAAPEQWLTVLTGLVAGSLFLAKHISQPPGSAS